MPFRDGTGPGGKGPMTGRSEGYCIVDIRRSFNTPVFSRGWFGPARGCRRGASRGRGRGLFQCGPNQFIPASRW